MKSPFGLCIVLAGLMATWNGSVAAQTDDPDYQMTDPTIVLGPETGFRIQAEVLAWSRNTFHNSAPIIAGPETFSQSALGSFGYTGGYRIGAAYLIDPNYEVEAVWTQFQDWTVGGGGVLNRAIAFNGGQASTLVDPTGNADYISTTTYFRPMFDAASDTLGNPPLKAYAFLNPGSTYTLHSSSQLYDLQANFKTRRSVDQRISFGIGYRNVNLGDNSQAILNGTFGTNDIPAGGNTNNTISDTQLTLHGLSNVSGPADGFTAGTVAAPTYLSMQSNSIARNSMNGCQGTLDALIFEQGPFMLEGLARAGLFCNGMTGTVQEIYAASGADQSVYGRTLTDHRTALSFAGNLGLNGVMQIGRRACLRGGYEAMVVTNTASSANQQVVYNSLGQASYSVKGGSTVILHGVRLGFEFYW